MSQKHTVFSDNKLTFHEIIISNFWTVKWKMPKLHQLCTGTQTENRRYVIKTIDTLFHLPVKNFPDNYGYIAVWHSKCGQWTKIQAIFWMVNRVKKDSSIWQQNRVAEFNYKQTRLDTLIMNVANYKLINDELKHKFKVPLLSCLLWRACSPHRRVIPSQLKR